MDYIFENNRGWVEGTISEDPDTFKRLATSQQPKYLYIGCSDSRVPAQNMMVRGEKDIFFLLRPPSGESGLMAAGGEAGLA